jgi:hypothetical protein
MESRAFTVLTLGGMKDDAFFSPTSSFIFWKEVDLGSHLTGLTLLALGS